MAGEERRGKREEQRLCTWTGRGCLSLLSLSLQSPGASWQGWGASWPEGQQSSKTRKKMQLGSSGKSHKMFLQGIRL